jgi:hypothetical protein
MDALKLIVGFVICALAASVTIVKFYRGPLPRWQIIGFALLGLSIIGCAAADWVLLDQSRADARVQIHLDATAAHTADLRRRIDANVAAMQAALAEPLTSHEPPSAERDQAWRNRVAALAGETGSLLRERDGLLEEIKAIKPSAAAAATREWQQLVSLLLDCAMFPYMGIVWLAIFLNTRKRRAQAEPQGGIDQNLASDHVRQLAASGAKIAAIKVFREETGANLFEAKKAVEALSNR